MHADHRLRREAPPAAASLSAWSAWGGDAQGRRYAPVTQITPNNVSRLVERKSVGTKCGFDNLQTVYGCDRCIDRTLLFVPPEKRDWLKDVQASLRKRLYLTKAQAQGVENWFKHIPGHQPLNPKVFQ